MKNQKIKKIILVGEAGHGINLLAKKLCDLIYANSPDQFISYYFDYDTAVRGGNTVAYIKTSAENQKQAFLFNKADIVMSLRDQGHESFKSDNYIGRVNDDGKHIDFHKEAQENFQNPRQANIIALGYLANHLELSNHDEVLKDILKDAYNYGFKLAKKHGARSTKHGA